MFSHPATQFTCRHCGDDAGYDPEICIYCGPVCGKCFSTPGPCPTKQAPSPAAPVLDENFLSQPVGDIQRQLAAN